MTDPRVHIAKHETLSQSMFFSIARRGAASLLALLCVAAPIAATGAVDVSAWSRQSTVNFTGYTNTETLTSFPVQVRLNASLISGFSYADFASTNGYDLRFTDGSTNAWLPYEIEKWNTGSSSYVWIKIPLLKAGTNILAFWGNASNPAQQAYTTNGSTWSSTYAGVWHLNETGGPFKDSTANRNHSIADANSLTVSGFSALKNARHFDGGQNIPSPTNGYIDIANSPSLQALWTGSTGGTNLVDWSATGELAMTVEFWSRIPSTPEQYQRIVSCFSTDGWGIQTLNGHYRFEQNGMGGEGTVNIMDNTWHYCAHTYNGVDNRARLYTDGRLDIEQTTGEVHGYPYGFAIGAGGPPNYYQPSGTGHGNPFNGEVDEVRITRGVRSASWIQATYLSIASNSTFITYGAAQSTGGGSQPPVARNRKLVLVAGVVGSHTLPQHSFYNGAMYWMTNQFGLNSIAGLTTVLVTNGWPTDVSVFDDADAIVLYSDGAHTHPWLGTEGYLGAQGEVDGHYSNRFYTIQLALNRGVAVGLVHYAVDPISDAKGGNQFLEWLGGHYGRQSVISCNPMWDAMINSLPVHPITQGVSPYALYDEWYYNMRFRSSSPYHTPILQAQVNPGLPLEYSMQTLAWAYTRPDGARGFGFTGGHWEDKWTGSSNNVRLLRNAITWIAKVGEADSNTVVIAAGSTWKYNDQGTNMAAIWREQTFADSAWVSARASLGYDTTVENPTPEIEIFKDPIISPVSYGPDANNKRMACYFRKTFVLADTNGIAAFLAKINADDGFVAYLNGTEIGRHFMPAGAVTYQTAATNLDTATGNTWSSNTWQETLWTPVTAPASLLVVGTNVLAIEVHQAAANSTDLRFDVEAVVQGGTPVVPVEPIAAFTAYNDVAWGAGQPDANITTLGFGSSGALKAYADGTTLDVQVSLVEPTAVAWSASPTGAVPVGSVAAQMLPPAAIDCTYHTYFNAVAPTGAVQFTGLTPSNRYTFVFYANRGGDNTYTDRYTTVTIQGADAFENNSTAGAASQSAPAATIYSGMTHGNVFQFDQVAPGADGAVSFQLTGYKPCLNAFMVQTPSTNTVAAPAPTTWAAYNDLAWASGQTTDRITRLTFLADTDHATGGTLRRYADGEPCGVTASFSGLPSAQLWVTTNAGAPAAGSPADLLFGGRTDMNRAVYFAGAETGTITLAGLTPSRRYKVALLGNRGDPTYTTRTTVLTLGGADSFVNASSAGAVLSGVQSETTTLVTGTNSGGLLFQYTDIASGADGQVQFTVTGNPGNTAYLNTLMVELLGESTDVDGDRMDDTWESTYFGGTNAVNGGAAEDFDHDGSTNYSEYRAGTSPTDPGSRLEVAEAKGTGTQCVLRWPSVSGKQYSVLQTTRLNGSWTVLQGGLPATPPNNVYTATVSVAGGYLRISVD